MVFLETLLSVCFLGGTSVGVPGNVLGGAAGDISKGTSSPVLPGGIPPPSGGSAVGSMDSWRTECESILNEEEGSKRASVDQTIRTLRDKNLGLIKVVATASTAEKRQEALSRLMKNKKTIVDLKDYAAGIFKESVSKQGAAKARHESLALNRRNLPKFQLASSAVKAFPNNEEVFESIDHYLRTFESFLNFFSLELETQWEKLLPLCMPNGERAWVDKTLLKCHTWSDAKATFARLFGFVVIIRRNTDLVYTTMIMKVSESIMDYTCRFQQAVYNAGLQLDEPKVADRFMTSLILPVQTAVCITLVRKQGGEAWTVDRITQVARDILGDDNYFYAHAKSLLPGSAASPTEVKEYQGSSNRSSSRKKRFQKGTDGEIGKCMHCDQHGANDTHTTKDCSYLQFPRARAEGICVKCGDKFVKGHACGGKKSVPGAAVSSATVGNHEFFATSISSSAPPPPSLPATVPRRKTMTGKKMMMI